MGKRASKHITSDGRVWPDEFIGNVVECGWCRERKPVPEFHYQATRVAASFCSAYCKVCRAKIDQAKQNRKWCSGCQTYKKLTDFYRNRSSKDGRHSACKLCEKRAKNKQAPRPERYPVAVNRSTLQHMSPEKFVKTLSAARVGACAIV